MIYLQAFEISGWASLCAGRGWRPTRLMAEECVRLTPGPSYVTFDPFNSGEVSVWPEHAMKAAAPVAYVGSRTQLLVLLD